MPLIEDISGNAVQCFVPDPAKVQVPSTIANAGTLTIGPTGTVDTDGWMAVSIRSTQDLTRHFAAATTKVRTIPANTDVVIILSGAIQVAGMTLTNNSGASATVQIEGM